MYPGCDCDPNEWSVLALPFTNNHDPIVLANGGLSVDLHDELGRRFTKERMDPLNADEQEKFRPKDSPEKRRALVAEKAAELTRKGERFFLSSDGRRIYPSEP